MKLRIDPLKFKICRISKGILQRDVAIPFNVTEAVVSRLETGRPSLLSNYPEKLAEILGVPVSEFTVEIPEEEEGGGND